MRLLSLAGTLMVSPEPPVLVDTDLECLFGQRAYAC